MKSILIVILGLIMVLPLLAQIDIPKPNFNPYQGEESSLLSLNRVSMSHSLGFSAGTSSNGNGYYLSRYTNHIKYAMNPKLDLELDLNFVNYGSASSKLQFNNDNQSKIIPEFKLSYRPSDNIHFQIELRQGNPWFTDQRPWYERW